MRPSMCPRRSSRFSSIVCFQSLLVANYLCTSLGAAEIGSSAATTTTTTIATKVIAQPNEGTLDDVSMSTTSTTSTPKTDDDHGPDPTPTPTPYPAPAAEATGVTTDGGQYIVPTSNILTPQGEVALDYKGGSSAVKLPEELEGGDHHISWNYLNQADWFDEYPQSRSSNLRQSPIDILTDNVIFMPRMKMQFVDYNQEVEFELKNTHHSVSLTPISSLSTPSLKINWIGTQEELFELQEIHFHWGDGKNKGSEHEINDKRAAAEMHMVHYRKGLDKTQIGSVENSVLVIGVLIESDAIEHNKLESLVIKSQKVNGTDLEYKDDNPQNLINLLPENHHSFYTYYGSLTTPPCYEVVTWVIMSEPVFMSQERLEELANMEANKPGLGRQKINSNNRDIQPLLKRRVYASFNVTDTSTYELTSDFQMKQIDGHNTIHVQAMSWFWAQVNKLNVSVKRAHKYVEDARKKLWETMTIKVRSRANESSGTN